VRHRAGPARGPVAAPAHQAPVEDGHGLVHGRTMAPRRHTTKPNG
jgi:hypothetical protein